LENPNRSFENPNRSFENPNRSLGNPNRLPGNESITCQHCLHTFSTKSNKSRHDKICKYKEDPIRELELELDIISELPESKTECRFCNKIFCRTAVLNKHIAICKEREIYKKKLIKEKDTRSIRSGFKIKS
jgi:hypothetical protein